MNRANKSKFYLSDDSRPKCVNGKCMEKDGTHFCRCDLGWQHKACDTCVPYWDCPYKYNGTVAANAACEKPNECFCPTGTTDPNNLCEKTFTPQ